MGKDAVVVIDETTSELSILKDVEGSIKALKGLKNEIQITSDYLKMSAGEEARFIHIGNTTMRGMSKNAGEIPAVRLLAEDGEIKVTAATVIVSTLSGKKIPGAYKIICTGETRKSDAGEYEVYRIFQLS